MQMFLFIIIDKDTDFFVFFLFYPFYILSKNLIEVTLEDIIAKRGF